MYSLLVALAFISATVAKDELGSRQLLQYLNEHKKPETLHTSYGYPVTYGEANLGINRDSSLLLNHYMYESLSSFSLERIPPRVVHANGCGAKGYFEVTHDVSHVLGAKVFNKIGKKTPILVRFSTTSGEIGSSEVAERGKGFAIKFYTEEGNMDLIGISTEAFLVKFTNSRGMAFGHIIKTNPRTGLRDSIMTWDFMAHHPEAFFAFIQTLSPAGQPNSYRHMGGHAIHTYQVENSKGEVRFVKFHWEPNSGIHNLTNQELVTIQGTNPDYLTEDLYNAISKETFPSWTLCMQVASKKDIETSKYDMFDVTMLWPKSKFACKPIGKLVLNKHVNNHFAEVEQAAFNPGNLVPGIRCQDKIFEARIFTYRDAQIYRLGTGYNRIDVNCPLKKPLTYNRDGKPPVGDNGGDRPNYYPNSFNGIVPVNKALAPLYLHDTVPQATNFWQAANYYKELSDADRQAMVANIGRSLTPMPEMIKEKVLNIISQVDADFLKKVKAVIAQVSASG